MYLHDLNISSVRYIVSRLEGHPCRCVEVSNLNSIEGLVFMDLLSLYDILYEDLFLLAWRAVQIVNWDKNNRFCCKCDASTKTLEDEMAKIYPQNGFISHTHFLQWL